MLPTTRDRIDKEVAAQLPHAGAELVAAMGAVVEAMLEGHPALDVFGGRSPPPRGDPLGRRRVCYGVMHSRPSETITLAVACCGSADMSPGA